MQFQKSLLQEKWKTSIDNLVTSFELSFTFNLLRDVGFVNRMGAVPSTIALG